MSGETRGLRSIGWRYYSGSPIDFYWPWMLFAVLWLGVILWLAGGFAGKPSEGPSLEAVAAAGSAPPLPCPAVAFGGPPSLMGIAAAVGTDGSEAGDAANLEGCTVVAEALAGWTLLADGRSGDIPSKALTAMRSVGSGWQSEHLCGLNPAWGEYRPIIAHIVASGAVEACKGGSWAARLPMVRGTGLSAAWAQFLTFALIILSSGGMLLLMMRSWRTRAAFRWLYQSQHG